VILTLLLIVLGNILSTVFVYLTVTENDLLKAIGLSAGQSIAYSVLLHAFASTDNSANIYSCIRGNILCPTNLRG